MTANQTEIVRPPAVAGMFYSDDPDELRSTVDAMLDEADPPRVKGTLIGIIVPHAGHAYSGPTAAHAYRLLRGRTIGTVIAVGPSHREYFEGISVYPGCAYRTPLGDVPIDGAIRDRLVRSGVTAVQAGHRQEHSLEVQLPFLQRVLGSFTLVPIVMGAQQPSLCHLLGKAIADASLDQDVLLVASSDLSHFHPYDDAMRLDRQVAELIGSYDTTGLMDRLESEGVEACGGGPVVAVMEAARQLGADHATILHSCNSGDMTGDRDSVVGYLSAALTRGS